MDILVLAIGSVVWGGALAGVAMVLQASMRISGAVRQALWRIVASLVLAPWIIAPLADWAGIGLPAPPPMVAQATIAERVTIVADEPVFAPVAAAVEPLVQEILIPWQAILIAVIAAGWLWRVVAARIARASLSRIVAKASDAEDGLARQSLESWSRRLGFQKAPRLLVVKEGLSPFSFGAVRPVICLPQGLDRKLGAEALDLVVGHECLHVARGDGWLGPVERLLADLIWFNPFAWRIRRELDVARELACDEAVLKHAQSHRAYARTLRNVAGITAGLDFAVPAASMSLAGSPRSLMLRVTRALSGAKSKPARAALFGVAVVALAGVPVACMQGVAAAPRVAAKSVAIENLKLAASLDEPLAPQSPPQPPSGIAPTRPIETPQARPLTGRVLRLSGNTQPVIDGKARLTSGYGVLLDPFTGKTAFHAGVDLAAYYDAPIHAPVDGIVTFRGVKGAFGRAIELDVGDGTKMLFGHLNTIKVEADAKVKAGDVLGTMGSTGRGTGPHLHFEYYLNGKSYDPLTIENLKFATSLDEPQIPPTPPAPPVPPQPQTAPALEAPQPVPAPSVAPQPPVTPDPPSGATPVAPRAPAAAQVSPQSELITVRAPFAARVLAIEPAAASGAVGVQLQQVASQARPVPAGGCDVFYSYIENPRVAVAQMIFEGWVIGFGKPGAAEMAASCDAPTPAVLATPSPQPEIRIANATSQVIDGPARFTSGYGFRMDPFTRKSAWHDGIDIAAYLGAPVHAPGGGSVTFAGQKSEYGNVVELALGGGFEMRFGQLSAIKVTTGDKVKTGDVVGTMGSTGRSTGPHLHFEVYHNGKTVDPMLIQGLTPIGPG